MLYIKEHFDNSKNDYKNIITSHISISRISFTYKGVCPMKHCETINIL